MFSLLDNSFSFGRGRHISGFVQKRYAESSRVC
jgi:hypothetical protein